jgi:hypothetical protein
MYNENKVMLNKAECLMAENFLKDVSDLTVEDKLHRFERRMQLNERVYTCQHITLNFDPLDQLSKDQMKAIVRMFMKDIGFEHQPYIVYLHHDAGHPHCHIVTTHVQKDGNPIELFNIGRNQSEKARKHIEAEFGLTTAEMKKQMRERQQQVDGIKKIKYGEAPVARSMARILEHVTENYKYSSLQDLNAVLRLYNVEAYRGRENSQLYQNRGLLYRVLDENGKYIGRPLKASFFDCKPTLDNLEKKFLLNQSAKLEFRQRMAADVQRQINLAPDDLADLDRRLARERMRMVMQVDKEGKCKEVSFVSFVSQCVFSGDELGGRCDRQALQKVLDLQKARMDQPVQVQTESQKHRHRHRLHL